MFNRFCSFATDQIDPDFLFYQVLSDEVYGQSLREAVGSNYPAVTDKQVAKFTFKSPESVDEQKNVADILKMADEAIERTKALIAKYEQIKQGLMQDLLTGKVRVALDREERAEAVA